MKSSKLLLYIISVWAIYAAIYIFAGQHGMNTLAGTMSFIGEVGLDIILVILCVQLIKMVNNDDRRIIYLMLLSFICAAVADGIYNVALNVLLSPNTNLVDSLYDIPFALFLFFQLLAWFRIFRSVNNTSPAKIIIFSYSYVVISIVVLLFYLLALNWYLEYTSLKGMYQLVDTVLEALTLGLLVTILCRTKEPFVRWLAMGYLLVIVSDLIIRSGFIANNIVPESVFEMTWTLGLSFMAYAFVLVLIKQVSASDLFIPTD